MPAASASASGDYWAGANSTGVASARRLRAAPPRPRRYSADVWDTESSIAIASPQDTFTDSTGDTIEEDRLLSVADIGLAPTLTERDMVLQSLHTAFDQALVRLPSEDDWDGEGSVGYAEETIERARQFLVGAARRLWEAYGLALPLPQVGAGPEGGIDLHWEFDGREALVTVPPPGDETIGYYGDDPKTKVKGEFVSGPDADWFFAWLAR